jgi:hypothetical protein
MTKNAYKILVGKPKEIILLFRLRKWEDNTIQMDFREIGCEGVDWIQFA